MPIPTNPTPDIPILDDDQVEQLEEEFHKQFILSHPGLMLNLSMLCQTVRALRAENESLKSKIAWHHDGAGPDVPVLQERYDKLIAQRNDLQSQLEQVTRERDEARRGTRRICTHPNTYPLGTASRRCHDCGLEFLL